MEWNDETADLVEKVGIAMWPHGEESWKSARNGTKNVLKAQAWAAVQAIEKAGYDISLKASEKGDSDA